MAGGIVVPLDGSRFAEAALPWAIRIARRDGRAITLAMVSDFSTAPEFWSPQLDQWEEEHQTELSRYLAAAAKQVEDAAGVPVSIIERKGSPAYVLPELMKGLEAGLVVMATHGVGGLTRVWLGSVSDSMVRRGGVPVLLVRPKDDPGEAALQPAPAMRRILVALDGSEVAERALRKSIILGSEAESVEILLLRVLPLPVTAASQQTRALRDQLMRDAAVEARTYLDEVAAKIGSWGAKVATYVAEPAAAWTGITDFAATHDVDLIVLATHGHGGAARLVLGSVADRVIRTADVPVLVVSPTRVHVESEALEGIVVAVGRSVGTP